MGGKRHKAGSFPQKTGLIHRLPQDFHRFLVLKGRRQGETTGNPAVELPSDNPTMTERIASQSKQLLPFVMLPKALFSKFKVKRQGLLAYVALAYYANNRSGACESITVQTMAEVVGVSPQTFRRGVAELEKKGIVKIRQRSRKGPVGRVPMPNLYEIQNIDLVTDPI